MLDKIILFSIKNKLFVGFMTLMLIFWGVWSATRLPIDAVPDITNNQVQIITSTPTLASQEVEQLVTFPIEQAIANIPGLEETRSISRFGLSVITAVFSEDMDIYFARQLVNEKLKEAQEQIPQGIGSPELSPVSTGLGEVYQYIIRPTEQSKNKYSAKDLRTMQDWIVARQLYGTKGIAEINSFGGELKQYEVVIDPDRLRAMGVSVSDIFTALEQNNQNTGGAYICILPPGTSLKQSLETSMQASRLIREFDEVKMVIGKTGSAEIPTDPMPLEASDIVIVLKSQDQWKSGRSYEELGDAIIERLKDIPGVFFEKSQPIQMRFNELMTGVRQDVTIKIFGENMDTLAHYAQRVSQLIQKTEGATAPQVEKVSGLPQINVTYDRVRLANYGLSVQEVNEVLSTAFAGKKAGVVFENERRFDLVVRLDSLHRTGIDDVQHMMVATENGQVPMSQLATIKYELGPAQVSREAGKRRIVIGFNVQGRDVQSVVSDIEQKLKGVKLPTGYYFTYGGQFENLQQATDRLLIAVPVALLLIFF